MVVIILRLLHIVFGAVWVGFMAFTVFFLAPAARDAGPDGAKVMGALQRRGLMTVMPIIGLTTIVSGFLLVERVWGGMGRLLATRVGQAYAFGAAVSLIAFALGVAVTRPAMLRVVKITREMTTESDPVQREARTTDLRRLQARAQVAGRLTAGLLLIAVAAMAVARYV